MDFYLAFGAVFCIFALTILGCAISAALPF